MFSRVYTIASAYLIRLPIFSVAILCTVLFSGVLSGQPALAIDFDLKGNSSSTNSIGAPGAGAASSGNVYYINPNSGSDSNSGTSTGQAWLTLSKANQTLQAGDTVHLMAGNYFGQIRPVNNGTSNENRITYKAYNDGFVYLKYYAQTDSASEGAIALDGRDYITVSGIADGDPEGTQRIRAILDSYTGSIGNVCGSEGSIVENIYAECPGPNAACSRGFVFCEFWWPDAGETKYNIFRNSYLKGAFTVSGADKTKFTEDLVVFSKGAHHNIVENNVLTVARHVVFNSQEPNVHSNVIRNNRIENLHHTALSMWEGGKNHPEGIRYLIEGNYLTASGTATSIDQFPGGEGKKSGNALQYGVDEVVVRNNVITNSSSPLEDQNAHKLGGIHGGTYHSGNDLYFATDGRFYNNTIVKNYSAAIAMLGFSSGGSTGLGRHRFINNFIYGSNAPYGDPYRLIRYWDSGHNTEDRYVRNVFGNPGGSPSQQIFETKAGVLSLAQAISQLSNPTHPDFSPWNGFQNVYDASPGFANYGGSDYTLPDTNQYVDSGAPLTAVRSDDAGSGTTLRVEDSRVFYGEAAEFPAWMNVRTEEIAIGQTFATATKVKIASVNDNTNTVFLTQPVTRSSGDFVWIWKNSRGDEIVAGAGPDIGAYEIGTQMADPDDDGCPGGPGCEPQCLPAEICGNGQDDDCNGLTDCDDAACSASCVTCVDNDNDGFSIGDPSCGPVDCNDDVAAINPNSGEICDDGVDNNCDGSIDCNDSSCNAHSACQSSCSPNEICGNGLDDDCNGEVDEGCSTGEVYTYQAESTWLVGYTTDSDGSYSNGQGVRLTGSSGTVNQTLGIPTGNYRIDVAYLEESSGQPTLEVFVGGTMIGNVTASSSGSGMQLKTLSLHNVSVTSMQPFQIRGTANGGALARVDKITLTEVGTNVCPDSDGDGHQSASCGGQDCNDSNGNVAPGLSEICDNGIDDNCNGLVDCDESSCDAICNVPVCTDNDGDGYSLEGGSCGAVDCNDSSSSVSPGQTEICGNGIDDNCNGVADCDDSACADVMPCNGCTDNDGDGFLAGGSHCQLQDCNDTSSSINPNSSEICSDEIDNNCNGIVDCDESSCEEHSSCQPVCEPTEICDNGIDDNCNGQIDENCSSGTVYTYEAESSWSSGYSSEGNSAYSNGQGMRLDGVTGFISQTLGIPSGNYRVDLYYLKENDGKPTVEIAIGETLTDTFTFPLATGGMELGVHTIPSASIESLEPLAIVGTRDEQAWARIDKITFTQISSVNETCFDIDGDGHFPPQCGGQDCNDNNSSISPGVAEVCNNGIDDNCNGEVDEDCNLVGYFINPSSGNDNHSGTSTSQAWKTLAKANATLVAGDTVYLMAGTYDDVIRPNNSGTTNDNRITYQAYGDGDIIMRGFALVDGPAGGALALGDRNYVTVRGRGPNDSPTVRRIKLQPQGDVTQLGNVCGSEGVIVEHIEATCPSANKNCHNGFAFCVGWWSGDRETKYNILRNSTFDGHTVASGPGSDFTADLITISKNAHHNVIENNTFGRATHAAVFADSVESHSIVIRNNTIANPHGNAVMIWSPGYNDSNGSQFLLEGNTLSATAQTVNPHGGASDALRLGIDEPIVRYNTITGGGSVTSPGSGRGGIVLGASSNWGSPYLATDARVYNNTIVKNGGRAIGLYRDPLQAVQYGKNKFVNNVIYGSEDSSGRTHLVFHYVPATNSSDRFIANAFGQVGVTNTQWLYYLHPYSSTSHTLAQAIETLSNPVDPEFTPWLGFENVDVSDPGFEDYANGDYRLRTDSAHVNGGAPLTYVREEDSGTGNVLRVKDSKFFYGRFCPQNEPCEWMGVEPEWIAVGPTFGLADKVQIDRVDDATNTIYLMNSIERLPGEHVWLWKDTRGKVVVYGSKPDLGANELYIPPNGTVPAAPGNVGVE